MKRIAIITLLAVFLTTNYAFATSPIEELAQKIEQERYEEITQEEIEELFSTIITSLDGETLQYNYFDCLASFMFAVVLHRLAIIYSSPLILSYAFIGYLAVLLTCWMLPFLI